MPSYPILAALAAAALLAAAPAARAELSPSCRAMLDGQRLSLIVPNGPGGGYDTYARAMAPRFEALAGVQARVENLPAAGGLAAYRRLIEAAPDEWVILLEEADDLIRGMADPALGEGSADRYRVVSVFHLEPSAWVTRPGFDLVNPPGGRLVFGSSSDDDTDELKATAAATGLRVTLIAGYDGSAAMGTAVLGGEVDVISVSLGSARRMTKGGDLAIGAVLSEGPWPDAPGVIPFAGPGSLLEQRLAGRPEADPAAARALGGYVSSLAFVVRSIAAQSSLPADRAACLDEAAAAVLADAAFRDAAAAEGRPVSPVDPAAGKAAVTSLIDAIAAFAAVAPTLPPLD